MSNPYECLVKQQVLDECNRLSPNTDNAVGKHAKLCFAKFYDDKGRRKTYWADSFSELLERLRAL